MTETPKEFTEYRKPHTTAVTKRVSYERTWAGELMPWTPSKHASAKKKPKRKKQS